MKSKVNGYMVLGIILLVLVILVFSTVSQTIFASPLIIQKGTQKLQPSTGSVLLNGITGEYETSYLGSVSSKSNDVYIGGNDDEGITITNTVSGGSSLSLTTSMKTSGETVNAQNTNEATFTFPKGTIRGSCILDTTKNGRSSTASTNCGIVQDQVLDKTLFSEFSCFKGNTLSDQCANENNLAKALKQTSFEYVLTEETTLTFYVRSQTDITGYAQGEIIVFFDEAEQPTTTVTENPECTANIDCVTTCGVQIPTCSEGLCSCDGILVNTNVPTPTAPQTEQPSKTKPNLFIVIVIGFILALIGYILYRRLNK